MKVNVIVRFVFSLLVLVSALANVQPQAVKAQDNVLLEETFENNDNGWEAGTSSGEVDVDNGILSVTVNKASAVTWGTPDILFPRDIVVQVDLSVVDGDTVQDWYAGIFVRGDRRDTKSSFYEFSVDGNGTWAFSVRDMVNSTYDAIETGDLKNFDPTDTNTLVVSVSGDKFTFTVNDEEVGTFSNDTVNTDIDETTMGLLIGTYKDSKEGSTSATAEFSNLVVSENGGSTNQGNKGNKGNNTTADFSEDFTEGNVNKWGLGSGDNSSSEITDNVLKITASNNYLYFSGPGVQFGQDVTVTATAQTVTENSKGGWYYGVGTRYTETSDGYSYLVFTVSNKGKWLFTHSTQNANDNVTIADGTIDNYDPEAENELMLVANGDQFEFFVNGEKVGEAEYSDWATNKDDQYFSIVLAGADRRGEVEVDFTSFSITEAK